MLRIKRDNASANKQHSHVPLKQVSVEANIHSFAADVTIKQIFRNDETTPIEAVYCFPIEEQAAIYAFIARIDDREIIAQLKEKKQAQRDYNNALSQGHGAYLLEQDEKSQDNFIINVGALPPNKECHIQISYVTELDLVQNGTKIRFVVPTTIAPRYNPDKGGISSPAGTNAIYVQSTPYTINFHCRIDKVDVTGVSSTSHPIKIDLNQQDVYIIEFAQQNTHLDRDILIDIELSQNRSNTIMAIESNAVMASFTPNEQDCQHAIDNTEVTNEFIFIVDCSGSMEDENKIDFARQAMLLFLKSLPINCHFNIIQFGSDYQTLFKDITVIYNKENAQQAEQLTNNMQANLGGTELLRPLQWLEEHPSKEGRARQIFLLTDEEISNVDQVLDLCRSMSNSTRIFSFGLGRSPSRSLVKGLARTTNGRFVFIPPDTNVDIYVGEQLEKALQSSITNIQIKWNLNRNVINVPNKTPPVYVNDRLIVYALVNDDNQSNIFDHNSSVELYNDKHRLGEAKINRIPNISDNGTIARLAAKALILELEHSKSSLSNKKSGSKQLRFEQQTQKEIEILLNDEKEERKKRIIELSLKYNILSSHTAFVGIEKRVNGNNDDMILREVPIQISADDQHLDNFSAMPMLYSQSMPQSAVIGWSGDSMGMFDPGLADIFSSCMYMEPPNMAKYGNMKGSQNMMKNYDEDLFECHASESSSSEQLNYSLFDCLSDLPNNKAQTRMLIENREEIFPESDQDIVRYLIRKQAFDGLWDLDSKDIEHLTGKSLSHFQQSTDTDVLICAIIILVLETRFVSFSSMWHGVVQKARKHLLHLLGNDSNKLNTLFENIRQQL